MISHFKSLAEASERVERKVLLSSGYQSLAEQYLVASGFARSHPPRWINTIYFDDIDFSCLRDNIDGNPSRDKLRLRFYDGRFDNTNIEVKSKRGMLGYKYVQPLEGRNTSLAKIIAAGNYWCKNNLIEFYRPVVMVEYERKYFVSRNIRATLDSAIRSSRINNLTVSPYLANLYGVVEFKYLSSVDTHFRHNFGHIFDAIGRASKSSKYANACKACFQT